MKEKAPRKFSTTPGTRDVLPPESTRLLDAQAKVLERFRLHGFREVITPALEYSEVIEEPRLRDSAFKLFDRDNQMLLLRPEVTIPVARLVAQRLRNAPAPHKLSYSLPVYRRVGVGRGQSAEFRQAGVEVVGSASPGEDAGAIALLFDVLKHLGLNSSEDFSVVLGQAAFYRGYLRQVAPEAADGILAALADKDLVRVDVISQQLPEDVAEGIRGVPRIVGPAKDGGVLERAGRYADASGEARAALQNLREILAHLEVAGCLEGVMLDFGLIGRHDYYTGAVYEVYASGLGFTVANGGRYDNLLRRFGEPLPATGFAISLERLVSVLPHKDPAPLVVLVGADTCATRTAGALRSSGVPVLHLAEDLPEPKALRYARSVEAPWVAYQALDGVKLVSVGPGTEGRTLPVEKVAGEVLS
jgi:ATP phosphoribosyltransferase regulatory subunit